MEESMFRPDAGQQRADVKEVINEVFSVENLLMRGILTKNQALQLSRSYAMAELWAPKYPRTAALLKSVCDKLVKSSVSTKGDANGRDGLSQALASVISVSTNNKRMMDQQDSRSWGGMGPKS